MMMQQPEDNLFADMLADYAAPVADDGFSEAVLQSLESKTRREDYIRKGFIYGASFIGGLIAATQLPALMEMAAKIELASPALPETSSLPLTKWTLMGLVLLGFVLWAALDRKASDIF